ncbi:BPK_HP2_G0024470.mRNA.1.CDS.1 [Saccharomyces cerevisiae]|nr:BPK_HP2_G0024470.mRNA.1.CDS.1 [Saccharomyces cerevisiae]CAI6451971.1 BPK_HP2_G0024470.mRNA.1.CDS.1 [Saccharomyces cerevisiae]
MVCKLSLLKHVIFSVQTFEGDENYLAEQCKPKQLKEYYTSAKVSNIPFVSQNSTLRLIESTFQTVEAEFTVLMENIRNMDTFLLINRASLW